MPLRNRWMAARLAASLAAIALPGTALAQAALADLVELVPAPPASVAVVAGWVQGGRIVEPRLTGLEAQLQQQRSAATSEAAAPVSTEANSATAPSSPAVLAAVSGYRAYLADNGGSITPAQSLAGRLDWIGRRFAPLRQASKADPERVQHLREQELEAYRALFTDWSGTRRPLILKAHRELQAAGAPAAVGVAADRAALLQYRLLMLGEIEAQAGLTRAAVERLAGLTPPIDLGPVQAGPKTLWDLMSNAPKK